MKYIIPIDGQWVGPPVLVLVLSHGVEKIIDGRKRMDEIIHRGLKTEIPRLIVRSHYEAIKYLMMHGHNMRAAQHAMECAPDFIDRIYVIEDFTNTQRYKFRRAINALRKIDDRETKLNKTKIANRALEVWNMTQEGKPLKLADLRWILEGAIDE